MFRPVILRWHRLMTLVALVTLWPTIGCQGDSATVESIQQLGGGVIRTENEIVVYARQHTGEPGAAEACWGNEDLAAAVPFIQKLAPQTLNLDMTRITDAGLVHLKGLTSVRKITFQTMGGFVSDEGLVHLHEMSQLEHLDFSGTKNIRGSGLQHLPRSLRVLDLNLTNVDNESLTHLAALPNLEELHLARTRITDDGLQVLGTLSLPRLRALHVWGNSISDTGIAYLSGFKSLRTVKVGTTMVTRRGAASLQAAIPGLVVDGIDLNEINESLLEAKD